MRFFALALHVALGLAAPSCHRYLGSLGAHPLGAPAAGAAPSDCCDACLAAAPSCVAWTFSAPGAAACTLFSSLGLGVASASPNISGTVGDDAVFDAPLALLDAPAASGVPLGGVGVGFFDIAPDGGVSRVALNGWHEDNIITGLNATFLAIARASQAGRPPTLLQTRPSIASPLVRARAHAVAAPLFPTMNVTFPDDGATVRAWSPFVPHDLANSSLPVVIVEVEVSNPTGSDDDITVAFSWQDVIARRLYDANASLLDRFYPSDPKMPCGWRANHFRNALTAAKIDARGFFPRVATVARPLNVTGARFAPLVGFEQAAAAPLRPNIFTLQHYVRRVVVLAEASDALDAVSVLPSFAAADAGRAQAAWQPFANGAGFGPPSFPDAPLFSPASAAEAASAVALRARVRAGATRTFRFFVSWWADELFVAPGQDNRTHCGTGDWGKPYHAAFADLEGVVAHAAASRSTLEAATRAWHAPLLRASVLPPWLSFKVINSAYTLLTNAVLTRGGRFSMMEGGMGGLAGTMDQRIVAHIAYSKLFPSTDALELAQFSASQNADGSINHFDAHFFAGITGTDGAAPLGDSEYDDNTIGWLYQVAKHWQQTGDAAFLALHAPRVAPALAFLATRRTSAAFPTLISASNTYDDFWELPLDAYVCSMYPLALEAARILLAAAGDEAAAAAAARDRDAATAQYAAALFNGRFFAYGAQLNGTGRTDDIIFGGQTAGQMLGRHAGWGDVGAQFNLTASALRAQLVRQVAPSFSFFAPKVFNLTSGARAVDPRNGRVSSTWPFYLESYTALAALQAGAVDDALALVRHVQLVQARLGLTWAQNLWNPGFITYVAAPVSWFVTDVLAGAALDAPAQTLSLAPFVRAGDARNTTFAVYFPQAWVEVAAQRAPGGGGGGALTLRVLRAFPDVAPPPTVARVRAAPLGTPAAAAATVELPAPWRMEEGAVLDLSAHFEQLVAPVLADPVLPAVAP